MGEKHHGALLPRRARCARGMFTDGDYRQCAGAVSWLALLFGGVLCPAHAKEKP